MYFVESKHPPGTIGIISNELSRYTDFQVSVVQMSVPENTKMIWAKGVEIAAGLNNICRNMYGEWLAIFGDDHVFHSDIVLRLLDDDKDIVAPLCSKRMAPFQLVSYRLHPEGFIAIGWDDIPTNTVFQVDGAGTAGMVIRKRVLDAIGDPWFEVGRTAKDHLGEDLWFCHRAREKGFEIWNDSRYSIGHITPAHIWPALVGDKLRPMVNFNGDDTFWLRGDTGFRKQATRSIVKDITSD